MKKVYNRRGSFHDYLQRLCSKMELDNWNGRVFQQKKKNTIRGYRKELKGEIGRFCKEKRWFFNSFKKNVIGPQFFNFGTTTLANASRKKKN